MVKGRIRARLAGKDGGKIPTEQGVLVVVEVMVVGGGVREGDLFGFPQETIANY